MNLIDLDFATFELRLMASLDQNFIIDPQTERIVMRDTPNFDYQSLALRTKSDQFFGDRVPDALLVKLLENASKAAEDLDAVKKAVFYGKDLPPHLLLMASSLPPLYDDADAVPTDILHSILGVITEGGELADAAIKAIDQGEPFDTVNFGEELGDVAWYRAIGLAAIGQTIDQNDRQNIDKLQLRFPNRFDMNLAINRDVDAERVVLEGKPAYDAILSDVTLIDRDGVICMRGRIRDDSRGRFDDGKVVRTTRIHSLVRNSDDQLIATTKNTTYLVESLDDASSS